MAISIFPPVSSGGGGGNGFTLLVGSSGNTTFTFDTDQPAGPYVINSKLSDTVFDVYLFTSADASAGYTSTSGLTATDPFNVVVIYGAIANDVLTFENKASTAPQTTGDIDGSIPPFLTSATPTTLDSVDDTTTVAGGNFKSDVEISFTGQNDVAVAAKSVVRSSATELIVTRPDSFPGAQQPFTLTATNPGITNPTSSVNKLVNSILAVPLNIEYLVIAGGGSGGSNTTTSGGGGGAGGYRTSTLTPTAFTGLTVTVGAGGAKVNLAMGQTGSNSVFSSITSSGGGGGGGKVDGSTFGLPGGSGGGANLYGGTGGDGNIGGYDPVEGYDGGDISSYLQAYPGAGGGGASATGGNATGSGSGAGGNGRASSITGTAVTRGGGGSGGSRTPSYGVGAAGTGGGGRGSNNSNSTAGTANTGGGGGGSDSENPGDCLTAGGSGVVILKYPDAFTATFSGGVTHTTPAAAGGYKVTTITATSTTSETVSFA
jgi:hypothetical protein